MQSEWHRNKKHHRMKEEGKNANQFPATILPLPNYSREVSFVKSQVTVWMKG